MFLLKPFIFKKFTEIIFAFTTKVGLDRRAPFYFNISFSVGDDEEKVKENRRAVFDELGLGNYHIHFQKQTHSDIVRIVNSNSHIEESDAMICFEPRNALVVTVADCVPIFIFDKKNNLIAAVHSGWRGTSKRILEKTLLIIKNEFNSNPKDLYVYLGPSISQANYEVGEEVASLFDNKYLIRLSDKFFLDVAMVNYDILLNFGIPKCQIQKSAMCTYEMKELFHSYRRDGLKSGRSFGVIALK